MSRELLTVGGLFLIAVLLGVFQAALSGVYSAVLYRYAVSHETPEAFRGLYLERAITKE